ncbi:hypothetical protein BpHYR1_001917 [Brachionus plicatilis]|uniref:Uncharacterized protein n=1 Tax=Brachionus plicatilis TaxID=10195 RepID=A0A3M7SDF0_BRAPC|nr:hypothetical protein BpHYR1_001917 [Brachionus plicatilis]
MFLSGKSTIFLSEPCILSALLNYFPKNNNLFKYWQIERKYNFFPKQLLDMSMEKQNFLSLNEWIQNFLIYNFLYFFLIIYSNNPHKNFEFEDTKDLFYLTFRVEKKESSKRNVQEELKKRKSRGRIEEESSKRNVQSFNRAWIVFIAGLFICKHIFP